MLEQRTRGQERNFGRRLASAGIDQELGCLTTPFVCGPHFRDGKGCGSRCQVFGRLSQIRPAFASLIVGQVRAVNLSAFVLPILVTPLQAFHEVPFSGRLVSQDPDDEPASVLLEASIRLFDGMVGFAYLGGLRAPCGVLVDVGLDDTPAGFGGTRSVARLLGDTVAGTKDHHGNDR